MLELTRRELISSAIAAAGLMATSPISSAAAPKKPIVYWTPELSGDALLRLYQLINKDITGRVALKLHTGEPGGPNILPREWIKQFQRAVPQSTIVESNVLYKSSRQTSEGHRRVLAQNGWNFCPVDILDEEGDTLLPVKGGMHLKQFHVGKHFFNYDSMVVLTHFKGHGMGGFGGSLKNIAIGCASGAHGKAEVHAVKADGSWTTGAAFMEHMADAGKGITEHFGKRIVYLNVLRNMSVDCDCAGVAASEPTMPDLGILASTDLVAIDQASIDIVYAMPKFMNHSLVKRIESREGLRQLSAMKELGMGTGQYEIVRVLDKKPGQRPIGDGTDEA